MGTDGESVRSLAEELRTLLGASGCSYTRIIYLGGRVGPRMRFTKSSLSGWFSGNAVPSNRADFDFLIELLEARAALRNSGHPRRSRGSGNGSAGRPRWSVGLPVAGRTLAPSQRRTGRR